MAFTRQLFERGLRFPFEELAKPLQLPDHDFDLVGLSGMDFNVVDLGALAIHDANRLVPAVGLWVVRLTVSIDVDAAYRLWSSDHAFAFSYRLEALVQREVFCLVDGVWKGVRAAGLGGGH